MKLFKKPLTSKDDILERQKSILIELLKIEIFSQLEVSEPLEKQTFGIDVQSDSIAGENIYLDIEVVFNFDENITPETYTNPEYCERYNQSFDIIAVNSNIFDEDVDLSDELGIELINF